jgi:hypothetical protein
MPDPDYILDLQTSNRKTNAPLAVVNKDVTYGSHYSHWGIGGYTELPSIEYRNAIPSADSISEDLFSSGRRKFGMVVYVISENKYYQLIPREANETDPTKPGTPVSLKKWLFYRGAKKTILLNPEKQGLDDFDDGTVVDELGEFGSPGAVDAATYDVISGSGDPNHCWTEVFVKDNFSTVGDLQDYVDNNTAAYAGQICSVIDTNKIYLIASDMSLVEFTGGGGSGAGGDDLLNNDLTVLGVSIGSYSDGQTIAKDTSLETIIKNMLQKRIPPTYVQPVFSISTNITSTYEIGTSISPTIMGNWTQNNAGSLVAYNIYKNSSLVFGPSSSIPLTHFTDSSFVISSNVVYNATAEWSDGDILDDNMSDPYPAGRILNNASNPKVSNVITFTPKRAVFYTADTATSAPTESSQIRLLTSRIDIGNGSTFTMAIGTNVKRIVIAYLKSYGLITSVIDSGTGYNIKGSFGAPAEFSVLGANGYAGEIYYVYTCILGNSYSSPVTYTVTI